MKKILLPTDFSENSYNAIRYAVQLFPDQECILVLLNTYTPIIYDNAYLTYNGSQPSLNEIYHNNAMRGLKKVEERIKKEFPDKQHIFKKVAAFNLLADEIKEQVREKEIDLVVMGTKGATGAEGILFGSHTMHAIKKAVCPLMAIPTDFDFRIPKEILFPTDYGVDYENILQVLKEIIKIHHSNLNILHVYMGTPLKPEQEKVKKKLGEMFGDYSHHFYSMSKKNLPKAIYDFQEENRTDLLTMVNNKHSFFENLLFRPVINEIGFHLKLPFLVIPSAKKKEK